MLKLLERICKDKKIGMRGGGDRYGIDLPVLWNIKRYFKLEVYPI